MSFTKQTIKDISLKNKTVILRADYNVPVEDGKITDDYRIRQSLPTIEYLQKQNCKIIVMSHLGRPKNATDTSASLWPVAKRLNQLLGGNVSFARDCVGPEVDKGVAVLQPKGVLLLENVRYHTEEEANDKEFAKQLAVHGQVFINDAFGAAHRAHASLAAITKYLPSVAGLLLQKEVDTITKVMEEPVRPLMAVIGGAKIADKIEILSKFIKIADVLVVGGAMANTFLAAEGIEMGSSKVDQADMPLARDIMKQAKAEAKKRKFIFYLPQDGVAATSLDKTAKTRIVDWDAHVIADVENYPGRPPLKDSRIQPNELILDIGPFSGAFISGCLQLANTVVWNGALGVTETPAVHGPVGPFSHGTELLVDAMLGEYGNRPFTLVGGGDTVGYITSRKLLDQFNHVSTGGGASLELMAGKKLPGVTSLLDKKK